MVMRVFPHRSPNVGRLRPVSQGELRSVSQFLSRSTTCCLYRDAIYYDRQITGKIRWIGVCGKVSFCFGAFQSIQDDALADFAPPSEFLTDRIRLRRTNKGTLNTQTSRRVFFVAVQISSALQ